MGGIQKVGFVFDGHRGVPNSDRANPVRNGYRGGRTSNISNNFYINKKPYRRGIFWPGFTSHLHPPLHIPFSLLSGHISDLNSTLVRTSIRHLIYEPGRFSIVIIIAISFVAVYYRNLGNPSGLMRAPMEHSAKMPPRLPTRAPRSIYPTNPLGDKRFRGGRGWGSGCSHHINCQIHKNKL